MHSNRGSEKKLGYLEAFILRFKVKEKFEQYLELGVEFGLCSIFVIVSLPVLFGICYLLGQALIQLGILPILI